MHFLAVAVAVGLTTGCSVDPAREAWFDDVKQVKPAPGEETAAGARYEALARTAPTPEDRCLAMSLAGRTLRDAQPKAAATIWRKLLAARTCRDRHDRAFFELALHALEARRPHEALRLLERTIQRFPAHYWARRAVEVMAARPADLGHTPLTMANHMVTLYNAPHRPASQSKIVNRKSKIGPHLLFHAANLLCPTSDFGAKAPPTGSLKAFSNLQPQTSNLQPPTSNLQPPTSNLRCLAALSHHLTVIDHHPDSVLWDDALWAAADLLAAWGYHGDETRLLEEATVPHPGRGTDVLAGGFVQRVRMRLARLYERQGRYRDALYQLTLVVNIHPGLQTKDDALWSLARIHGTLGNVDKEHQALTLLIQHCPWSRHLPAARKRLQP